MENNREMKGENLYLSTRLRTKRTKKRLRKEAFDKYLLWAEKQMLSLRRKDIYYEYLSKPIQRGYVRTFQLTDEAMRMPDAMVYQHVLDLINTRQYSNYPIFEDKLGKKKAKRLKRKALLQEVRNMTPYEYNQLDDKSMKMFEPVYALNFKGKYYISEYRFKYVWLFKLVVLPYMVDKVEKIDCDVKRQYSFYEKIYNAYSHRISYLHGFSWDKSWYKYKDDVVKADRELLRNIPNWNILDVLEGE